MKLSKSFMSGYARVLDPFRHEEIIGSEEEEREKDYLALKGDWEKVGEAIRKAANSIFTEECTTQ